MFYCNEFYGLNVLSLYEGELLGVVDKLFFDKKLKKLIELELVGEEGNKLTLPTKNIYHIGKNAITVKNNQAVSIKVEENSLSACPINSKAYTIKGEFLGVIKEISLNEKFLCEKFSLDNDKALDVSALASSGKNTTIFYENSDSINVKKFTPQKSPKIFKSNNAQTAKILPIKSAEDAQTTTQNSQQNLLNSTQNAANLNSQNNIANASVVEIDAPKNLQNSDFLLGRVCTKDIFNFNNEILIKAHAIINKKNLKEINKYGKLRELMLFSK